MGQDFQAARSHRPGSLFNDALSKLRWRRSRLDDLMPALQPETALLRGLRSHHLRPLAGTADGGKGRPAAELLDRTTVEQRIHRLPDLSTTQLHQRSRTPAV